MVTVIGMELILKSTGERTTLQPGDLVRFSDKIGWTEGGTIEFLRPNGNPMEELLFRNIHEANGHQNSYEPYTRRKWPDEYSRRDIERLHESVRLVAALMGMRLTRIGNSIGGGDILQFERIDD